WMHSIEKIRWEEDWRIEGRTLVIAEARIRGSGAGMEPPAGAVLRLTHSPYAAGYTLCTPTVCRPLADQLPGIADNALIEITPC
ncbi:MAG: DUF1850 domain-containing protein, partial [Sulfuritalea sp.]|nr:DUF1850 domain-containing protein [Sulfuritalea sp.]